MLHLPAVHCRRLCLLIAAPALAQVSLSFQSSDYFALMLVGLSAVAAFAGKGQVIKAWMMTIVGLMLATVGIDKGIGVERFTFGLTDLMDGFSFLLLAMATFALGETLMTILKPADNSDKEQQSMADLGSMKITKEEFKELAPVSLRSSILGFFVGILPGAGATIAAFLSYGVERNLAPKDKKSEFGKGSLRGLVAPESANNAASSGSFVPLLTLGIPGSGTTAIMLGALISYGVQPGPRLFVDNPEIFWSVIISMYIGNIVLMIMNLPLIPYISKALAVPRTVLLPMIIFFSITGVYLVSFNTVDVFIMIAVAMVAVILRLANFPLAPLLLGFILGGLLEENLRRSLMLSDGELSFLWERPITLSFSVIAAIVLITPIALTAFNKYRTREKTLTASKQG